MTTQTAKLNYLRIAPRKVRSVADLIRGMSVNNAEAQLLITRRRPAQPILKLLRSAIANAKNKQMNPDHLFIAEIRGQRPDAQTYHAACPRFRVADPEKDEPCDDRARCQSEARVQVHARCREKEEIGEGAEGGQGKARAEARIGTGAGNARDRQAEARIFPADVRWKIRIGQVKIFNFQIYNLQ